LQAAFAKYPAPQDKGDFGQEIMTLKNMYQLFEQSSIKDLTLKNRFVRSATWEGLGTDKGGCSQRLVDLMVRLARGGVGLIITGHTYISPEGQAGPWQLGICRDDLVPELAKLPQAVHKACGRIILQLAHAGCRARVGLTREEALGPSALTNDQGLRCRAMTIEQIQKTIEDFKRGAVRAKEAGFDGVQIHAAHGYLLSQFLSPFFNRREDEYGGSIVNRARMILEVFRHIREGVGERFPVLIKINSQDFMEGGLTVEEMLEVAAMLQSEGIDAIELSGGAHHSGKYMPLRTGNLESPENEVYYMYEASRYKEKIRVPLMVVGGIRSYQVAEKIVREGLADYVSLARPLIREPDLINRWKSGDLRKAMCKSDNQCLVSALQGKGLSCVARTASPF
jgi:2,4-dienoyl-CoA reductase-like NADH-dependent reductase (Old Yellow Enzyme family)